MPVLVCVATTLRGTAYEETCLQYPASLSLGTMCSCANIFVQRTSLRVSGTNLLSAGRSLNGVLGQSPKCVGLCGGLTRAPYGNTDFFRFPALLAFFEEGQGQRAQPTLQKHLRALPNEKTLRFQPQAERQTKKKPQAGVAGTPQETMQFHSIQTKPAPPLLSLRHYHRLRPTLRGFVLLALTLVCATGNIPLRLTV